MQHIHKIPQRSQASNIFGNIISYPGLTRRQDEVIRTSTREGNSRLACRAGSDEAEVRASVDVLVLARVVVVKLSQRVIDLHVVRSVSRVAKDLVVGTC